MKGSSAFKLASGSGSPESSATSVGTASAVGVASGAAATSSPLPPPLVVVVDREVGTSEAAESASPPAVSPSLKEPWLFPLSVATVGLLNTEVTACSGAGGCCSELKVTDE